MSDMKTFLEKAARGIAPNADWFDGTLRRVRRRQRNRAIVAGVLAFLIAAGVGTGLGLALTSEPRKLPVVHPRPTPWQPTARNGLIAYVAATDKQGNNLGFVEIEPDGSGRKHLSTPYQYTSALSFSPDGKKIVIDIGLGEAQAAFDVMNADGTGERRITKRPYLVYNSPAWSPDGNRIAFITGTTKLAIINVDGTGFHTVPGLPPKCNEDSPSWSPDGTRLVYQLTCIHYPNARDTSAIEVIGADGSGRRTLIGPAPAPVDNGPDKYRSPAWSPDGAHMVFAQTDVLNGGFDQLLRIYVMDANGSDVRRLTDGGTEDTPAWSPDGRFIAYTGFGGRTPQIYVMNANGTGQRQLTHELGGVTAFAWQPLPIVSRTPSPSVSSALQVIANGDNVVQFRMISRTAGWLLTDHHLLLTTDAWKSAADIWPPGLPPQSDPGVWFADAHHGWVALDAYRKAPGAARIYRTSDGGRHWARSTLRLVEASGSFGEEPHFIDPTHGWLAIGLPTKAGVDPGGMLYATSDGGASWIYLGHVPGSGELEFTGPNAGWSLGGANGETTLYRTTDGGRTWHRVATPGPGSGLFSLSLPQFVSSSFGVLKEQSLEPTPNVSFWVTRDGGTTWSSSSTPADQTFLNAAIGPIPFQVIDQNDWVATMNEGVLFLTKDAGTTWTRVDVGAPWMFGLRDSIQFPALDEGWILSCGIHSEGSLCADASLILVLHGGTVWTSVQPLITKPTG